MALLVSKATANGKHYTFGSDEESDMVLGTRFAETFNFVGD